MSLSIDPFEHGEHSTSRHGHRTVGLGTAFVAVGAGLAIEGLVLALRAPQDRVFVVALQASAVALIFGIGLTLLSPTLCRKRCRELGRSLTLAGAAFGVLHSLLLVLGPQLGWFGASGLR